MPHSRITSPLSILTFLSILVATTRVRADEWPAPADERQLVVVTDTDYSSAEFTSSAVNPLAVFDLWGGYQRLHTDASIVPWLGHSWGSGWDQTRYQAFRLEGLIPGVSYRIKLKFWWKSRPVLNFEATMYGARIAALSLDDAAMNHYWEVEFTARGFSEDVQITHDYAHDGSSPAYAMLDYLEITARDGGSPIVPWPAR
jgi:hypothetical protein